MFRRIAFLRTERDHSAEALEAYRAGFTDRALDGSDTTARRVAEFNRRIERLDRSIAEWDAAAKRIL